MNKVSILTLAFFLIICVFGSIILAQATDAMAQTTWFVDDDRCPATGSGTAINPFCSIQSAINAGTTGDTIMVSSGTYNENILWENKDMEIYGSGSPTCLIDGGTSGPAVITGSLTAAALLEGFTLSSGSSMFGGGMYNFNSSLNIGSCSFTNSFAFFGGGMCNEFSSPAITNCTFRQNFALLGGGMANLDSIPTLTNCTFSGSNTAIAGAGMLNIFSDPVITDCDFKNNDANIDVYAILAMIGMSGPPSFPIQTSGNLEITEMIDLVLPPELTHQVVSNGSSLGLDDLIVPATQGALPGFTTGTPTLGTIGFGGGIFNFMSSPDLEDCNFTGNRAGEPHTIVMSGGVAAPPNISGTVNIGIGGGMVSLGGTPSLTGCEFNDNYACTAAGGMLNLLNTVYLDQCDFIGNATGLAGGAILNLMIFVMESEDCNFENNYAAMEVPEIIALLDLGFNAMAMIMEQYGEEMSGTIPDLAISESFSDSDFPSILSGIIPEISAMPSVVVNGTPSIGSIGSGGAIYGVLAPSQLDGCVFSNNYAGGSNTVALVGDELEVSDTLNIGMGGGIVTVRFGINPIPTTLTNCDFNGNRAAVAGGMLAIADTPEIDKCTFTGNSADFSGGGMLGIESMFAVNNSIFSSNTAGGGGGIFTRSILMFGPGSGSFGLNGAVTNCTFYGNSAYSGSGIENMGSAPTITNSIFWGGTGTPIYSFNGTPVLSLSGSPVFSGTPIVTYSDVEGGYPGIGNINGTPVFENPGIEDFHLQFMSPCIGAGNNAAAQAAGLNTDKDGLDRIINIVDMGAYERAAVTGESADDTGKQQDDYDPADDVYAMGSGFEPGSLVDIYITPDLTWYDGRPITGTPMATGIVVSGSGTIFASVWAPPLTIGEYDMVFDTGSRNAIFNAAWDDVDDPNHPGFVVQISGGNGPTVGGQVMMVNKFELLAQCTSLPIRLMKEFSF